MAEVGWEPGGQSAAELGSAGDTPPVLIKQARNDGGSRSQAGPACPSSWLQAEHLPTCWGAGASRLMGQDQRLDRHLGATVMSCVA